MLLWFCHEIAIIATIIAIIVLSWDDYDCYYDYYYDCYYEMTMVATMVATMIAIHGKAEW